MTMKNPPNIMPIPLKLVDLAQPVMVGAVDPWSDRNPVRRVYRKLSKFELELEELRLAIIRQGGLK